MTCSLIPNAAFNNNMFSPATIRAVRDDGENHESMKRLLEAAGDRSVRGPSALAAALGESDQTVTNWGRRGVSKQGALKAQERLGISATWIRDGSGAKWSGSGGDQPAAQVLSLRPGPLGSALVLELGAALDSMTPLKRSMARAVLVNLVDRQATVEECAHEFAGLLGGGEAETAPTTRGLSQR